MFFARSFLRHLEFKSRLADTLEEDTVVRAPTSHRLSSIYPGNFAVLPVAHITASQLPNFLAGNFSGVGVL